MVVFGRMKASCILLACLSFALVSIFFFFAFMISNDMRDNNSYSNDVQRDSTEHSVNFQAAEFVIQRIWIVPVHHFLLHW
jgi:hypothetical protein